MLVVVTLLGLEFLLVVLRIMQLVLLALVLLVRPVARFRRVENRRLDRVVLLPLGPLYARYRCR